MLAEHGFSLKSYFTTYAYETTVDLNLTQSIHVEKVHWLVALFISPSKGAFVFANRIKAYIPELKTQMMERKMMESKAYVVTQLL